MFTLVNVILQMNETQSWYIVKRTEGYCEIVPSNSITELNTPDVQERWGPFASQDEAVARRIGLIRAGKCQPL